MKKELQEKEEEMNRKMNETILKERKNLTAQQKIDIDNLRKEHHKEIDVIQKFIQKFLELIGFFLGNS